MRSPAPEVDPRIDFCTWLTSPAEADLPVVAVVPVAVVPVAVVPVAAPRWWNQSRRRNQ
jgi:hypothetical protein